MQKIYLPSILPFFCFGFHRFHPDAFFSYRTFLKVILSFTIQYNTLPVLSYGNLYIMRLFLPGAVSSSVNLLWWEAGQRDLKSLANDYTRAHQSGSRKETVCVLWRADVLLRAPAHLLFLCLRTCDAYLTLKWVTENAAQPADEYYKERLHWKYPSCTWAFQGTSAWADGEIWRSSTELRRTVISQESNIN